MAHQGMPLTSTMIPPSSPWFQMMGRPDPYAKGEPLTEADMAGIAQEVSAEQAKRNLGGLPMGIPAPQGFSNAAMVGQEMPGPSQGGMLPLSQIPYALGQSLRPDGSRGFPPAPATPQGQGFSAPKGLPKGAELAKEDLLQNLFNTQKNAANALRGNMTPYLDQFGVLANSEQGMDLSALATLVDQWTGSNMARGYKAPESLYDRAREVTGQADKFRQAADQQDLSALQNLVEGRRAESKMAQDKAYKDAMLGLKREELGIQRLKANAAGLKLPEDTKKMVTTLADSVAKKTAIANQIKAGLEQFRQARANGNEDLAVSIGNQMVKVLNSTEGSDAVGAEEVERLASFIKYKKGNLTQPGSVFGRDLDQFDSQVESTVNAVEGAAGANRAQIDQLMGRTASTADANPLKTSRIRTATPSAAPKAYTEAEKAAARAELARRRGGV